MKAWQYTTPGIPLLETEVAVPVPGAGEVLIDVKAAGLCHTDVGIVEGWSAGMLNHTPITLGHEVAGVISALGEGVTGFAIGDRVGLFSEGLTGPGIGKDGGFAPETIGRVSELVRMPDSVPFDQAAAGTDAGATSYHAVKIVGRVEKGMKVGIIGLGGLGQIGARVAVLLGAEVYAAEVNTDVHAYAREIGVSTVVTLVTELAGLGLDVVIDFAGAAGTTSGALGAVKAGGRVVQIGVAEPNASIDLLSLVMKQVELVGSLGGSKADIEAVYELLASGELNPRVTTIGFDEIGDGMERLRRGEIRGRLVAVAS
jgi:propanol-preferring alcohol dehydrogenase